MQQFLKDPLVRFLGAGALLFAVFAWRGDSTDVDPARVVISSARVAEAVEAATILEGRAPTAEEVQQLIDPLVRDEILYREALALGLDENDDEVRRRLVEKMQYLTEDLADPEPASEQALRDFFAARPDLFRIPEQVTFDQLFFSPRQRGDALDADVADALAQLRDGAPADAFGDPTPLRSRFVAAPREQVQVLFGDALTDAVFSAEPGTWLGPFASDFGLHLVRIVERTGARQPAFEEVRDEARRVFADQRRAESNAEAYARLRARYEVVVDWPEDLAPEAAE